MKIALLNSVCTGSTGKIACGTARLLQQQGHDARLFYGRGDGPADLPCLRVSSRWEVYAHVAGTRLTGRHGFCSERAGRRLVEELKAFAPDIIQLHNIHGYWMHLPTLFDYLKTCGKPVVWTLHDCWAFTGHCAYFDAVGCGRWRTRCGDCTQKRAYPQSLLFDASAKDFLAKRALFTAVPDLTLVTPSRWLAGYVQESFLSGTPTEVLPNGIDQMVFCPRPGDIAARHGLSGKRILLGVANVWEPRKGLSTFFELRKRLDEQYAIVLIGLNERQRKGLPEGILGLGRTSGPAELAQWYTAADVFVDPTHEENFPTTHLEALSCGTPVVTFLAGGSGEMLTPSCGVGVTVGDVAGLIAGIETALSLKSADCLAQAAQYSQEARLGAYIGLYERLVREGQS